MSIDNNLRDKEIAFLKDYFEKMGFEEITPLPKYGSSIESDDNRFYKVVAKTSSDSLNTRGLYLGYFEKIDFVNKEVEIDISVRDLSKIRFIVNR